MPTVSNDGASGTMPARETRPIVVFKPITPQNAAGIRIEPPVSVPIASGTSPAATAAADPPLDPPGTRSRFHGLRVDPRVGVLGGDSPRELVRTGEPDDDRSGAAQRTNGRGIGFGTEPGADLGTVRVVGAGDVEDLLHPDRHTVQQSAPATTFVEIARVAERSLAANFGERADPRIETIDAIERCFGGGCGGGGCWRMSRGGRV